MYRQTELTVQTDRANYTLKMSYMHNARARVAHMLQATLCVKATADCSRTYEPEAMLCAGESAPYKQVPAQK